jgi:phage/plasmid-like protein (TIGR03299 family)
MRTQDKAYAIVRNDTGACLGVVGSQYQVIQNHEAFDFMDTVLKEFGAKYETAGSIYGGEKTWMLVQLPQQSFTLPGDDENLAYSIFTNPHDGSGMAYCYPTNVRTVCANTYRRAESMKDRGIGLRHTGDLKARIAEARRALGLTVKGFAKFAEVAGVMVRTPLPDVKVYVNEVLDEVLDITAAKIAEGADAIAARIHGAVANTPEAQTARDKLVKHLERQIARRREIVDDILTIYEGPTCKIGDMSGTAWAGWNSVTGWIAHGKTKQRQVGTMEARLSRKFESIICGDGDNVNQIAFQKALEYLPA